MMCCPSESAVVNAAVPLPSNAVGPASTVVPSRNVTAPTLTAELSLAFFTVAENVTDCATSEGLSDDPGAVIVAASPDVVMVRHQPAILPLPLPATSSITYRRQVPFGLPLLKAVASVAAPAGA